jgi:hypothetical protein
VRKRPEGGRGSDGLSGTGTTSDEARIEASESRPRPGALTSPVGQRRGVLVFGNRLVEILVYLVMGMVFLVLGLVSSNVNYQVLFFILTAFFIFAIFRPTSLP